MQREEHQHTFLASAKVHLSWVSCCTRRGFTGSLRPGVPGRPETHCSEWWPHPALLSGVALVIFIIHGGLLLGTLL